MIMSMYVGTSVYIHVLLYDNEYFGPSVVRQFPTCNAFYFALVYWLKVSWDQIISFPIFAHVFCFRGGCI